MNRVCEKRRSWSLSFFLMSRKLTNQRAKACEMLLLLKLKWILIITIAHLFICGEQAAIKIEKVKKIKDLKHFVWNKKVSLFLISAHQNRFSFKSTLYLSLPVEMSFWACSLFVCLEARTGGRTGGRTHGWALILIKCKHKWYDMVVRTEKMMKEGEAWGRLVGRLVGGGVKGSLLF